MQLALLAGERAGGVDLEGFVSSSVSPGPLHPAFLWAWPGLDEVLLASGDVSPFPVAAKALCSRGRKVLLFLLSLPLRLPLQLAQSTEGRGGFAPCSP